MTHSFTSCLVQATQNVCVCVCVCPSLWVAASVENFGSGHSKKRPLDSEDSTFPPTLSLEVTLWM